jgi:hypothetical protein
MLAGFRVDQEEVHTLSILASASGEMKGAVDDSSASAGYENMWTGVQAGK